MKRNWNITVDGHTYDVAFKRSEWTGKQTLTIDGEEMNVGTAKAFKQTEVPIKFGDTDAILSMVNGGADIIVDGKSVLTGEEYVKPKKAPWFTWVFVVICVAIPICTLGGALPVLIGLLSAGGCYKIGVSGKMKSVVKFILMLLIAIVAWLAVGLVLMGTTMLLNS